LSGWLLALVAAAATVGSLHTLAPDHWMPFAALGRARGWSTWRTARTTILCGLGHVTVSAALGIAALFAGLALIEAVGTRLENQAIYLLMAFGTIYMVWGLRRSFRRDHHHRDHGLTEWSLFLLFCADPCVAVIPMIIAASSGGWAAVGTVVVAYEVATIGTMVALVTTAHAGARALRAPWLAPWLDRYGDATAGALIVTLGATLAVLEM